MDIYLYMVDKDGRIYVRLLFAVLARLCAFVCGMFLEWRV